MTLYFHNATYTEQPDRATGEEVEGYDFWNLWKVRMAPWADLSEGDRVVLVETWPGGSRLTWEVQVTGMVKDVYSRKADAVRAIAALHGLTRGEVLSDPYTADKSDEGVFLAWAGKPVRALYVARPADLPMRRNGWAVVEDDDLLQSWGLSVPSDDPTSTVSTDARDAVQVLTDLIGRELATTRRGRGNRILSVQPPDVIVGTEKSPHGQPVPIEWVQHGLDLLRRHGAVTIDVDTLGHRSSFVGAVLATLPGATVSGSPPVLTLFGDAGDSQSGEICSTATRRASGRSRPGRSSGAYGPCCSSSGPASGVRCVVMSIQSSSSVLRTSSPAASAAKTSGDNSHASRCPRAYWVATPYSKPGS